ncbi:MAG: dephospho-CoA kinase [Trichococcus flocculiformis]|uniref:Dephospho-CoA kinase n=1 Tax=Trichococcus flocculiformis TaxID=82803 RepID=A0A847D6G0_9LACT|nr:dephospho-CoA kinase [Trichococcus flocculiformis]NLD32205.1 dephospho-CoA kinase [Trichococcus flocculiformis]
MSYILGLTGSIATGKSTVAKLFLSAGIPVVDADLGARAVVLPGAPGLADIIEHFGEAYLLSDGTLDRKRLGALIFSDREKRKELDVLLKERINDWIQAEKERYISEGHKLIVLDIPLLYEGGYEDSCDAVMVVYVPEELQVQRLMSRNHLDADEAIRRMQSQLSIEKKKELADFVIDNSGTIEETKKQVNDWLLKHRTV